MRTTHQPRVPPPPLLLSPPLQVVLPVVVVGAPVESCCAVYSRMRWQERPRGLQVASKAGMATMGRRGRAARGEQ